MSREVRCVVAYNLRALKFNTNSIACDKTNVLRSIYIDDVSRKTTFHFAGEISELGKRRRVVSYLLDNCDDRELRFFLYKFGDAGSTFYPSLLLSVVVVSCIWLSVQNFQHCMTHFTSSFVLKKRNEKKSKPFRSNYFSDWRFFVINLYFNCILRFFERLQYIILWLRSLTVIYELDIFFPFPTG